MKNSERLIDLSHTIENGLVTYKGLPAPVICDYLSREDSKKFYEPGTEFQIGKIEMVSNTGTYVDCPFHRFAEGKDLAAMPLDAFAELRAAVVRVPWRERLEVTPEDMAKANVQGYEAVLVNTGWSEHWNTERYYENHPYLSEAAAKYLADCKVKLVGIDSHNIDDTRKKSRPVHTTLLAKKILIVEHLCNLEQLPGNGFAFSAVPPKFRGVGTFPVRAMARLQDK